MPLPPFLLNALQPLAQTGRRHLVRHALGQRLLHVPHVLALVAAVPVPGQQARCAQPHPHQDAAHSVRAFGRHTLSRWTDAGHMQPCKGDSLRLLVSGLGCLPECRPAA